MNLIERKMSQILTDLRENHHVIGVKAEFEAEGTRLEEALRLKEVISKAGLDLTVKIGGCEAIKDMYDARAIGVSRIVAPMVESPYALKKFVQSFRQVFPEDERTDVVAAINIETKLSADNFDEMLKVDGIDGLNGIVLGRVDLCGSLGLTREDINKEPPMAIARTVFAKAKAAGKVCAIGGGVSADSLAVLRDIPASNLDYYETRKVIFGCPAALGPDAQRGILKAVAFELHWLKNKRDYYGMIFAEDKTRIEMLEKRYRKMMEEQGVAA